MTMRTGRNVVLASSVGAATLLLAAGCETAPETGGLTVDALIAENEDLRQANSDLDAALTQAQNEYAALVVERDQLFAENARLRDGSGVGPGPTGGDDYDIERRGGETALIVSGDVLFTSGSVVIRNDAKRTLSQIASRLNSEYAGNQIRIAGHTDSDPIRKSQWKTNERLSSERALAVEDYLASRGVSRDRMYIAGYGDAKPRGTKNQSRRVEIVVLEGGS